MSVQPIIQILEKLEKMHKSLLELAYKKTELIKKGDMGELDTMLKNEQSHVAAIEILEKQRQQQVIGYLSSKNNTISGTSTVLDLIEATESTEDRQRLEQLRNQLISITEELKQQNDLNQKLVFQSLQFVNMTLDMIRPQQEQINYSSHAVRGEGNGTKKSFFDSQA